MRQLITILFVLLMQNLSADMTELCSDDRFQLVHDKSKNTFFCYRLLDGGKICARQLYYTSNKQQITSFVFTSHESYRAPSNARPIAELPINDSNGKAVTVPVYHSELEFEPYANYISYQWTHSDTQPAVGANDYTAVPLKPEINQVLANVVFHNNENSFYAIYALFVILQSGDIKRFHSGTLVPIAITYANTDTLDNYIKVNSLHLAEDTLNNSLWASINDIHTDTEDIIEEFNEPFTESLLFKLIMLVGVFVFFIIYLKRS